MQIINRYFLLVFLPFLIILGQLSENELKKIDPRLYEEISNQVESVELKKNLFLSTKDAELIKSTDESGMIYYNLIVYSQDPNELKNAGFPLNSVFKNFATARLTAEQIIDISRYDIVSYITPGDVYYPNNDVATGLIGADLVHDGYINATSYKGSGVIVCIIDSGIDWEHLDFRNPNDNTQSRILYIWDVTLSKDADESNPSDRGLSATYGVEYTNTQIENELDGSPTVEVRTEDTNGHGTHVAGTAAGNGASMTSQKYAGIAPEADILVVKAGNGSFSNAVLIDALTYAQEVASNEGKPVVVNMSLGGHSTAHDGTSSLESAVDAFVDQGRVAVISAGNEGDENIHISGSLAGSNGATSSLNIDIPTFSPTGGANNDYVYFKLWLDDATDITATVTSPSAISYSRDAGQSGTGPDDSDGAIYINNSIDPNNGDRFITVVIDDDDPNNTPAVGSWTIEIENNTTNAVDFHGWLYSTSIGGSLPSGNTNYTVGSPGNADEAITVGSYVSRWRWMSSSGGTISYGSPDYSDDISTFSSIGPTREDAQKPDIVGPGQAIISASSQYTTISTNSEVTSNHHANQGTSMSAPAVSGAVALLLDYDATLTGAEIKTLITDPNNTDTDSYTGGSLPDYTWGYGKINIFKTLAEAINSAWTPNQELLAYDEWTGNIYASLSPGEYAAVRFSPSISGSATGAFFHVHDISTLTSDISFEIWSDNSGIPDSKLGNTVTFGKDNILKYSWNYVDLSSSGVSITSGTDYHLVSYYSTGTELRLLMDASSSDGRSTGNSGGGWGSYTNNDFRMRTVISEESSELPVELVSFIGELIDDYVMLEWETAMEINNFGFDIERRTLTDESDWEKLGFVEGHGTTASPNFYEYIDESPPAEELEYRLKQIDNDGTVEYYDLTAKVNASITSVEDQIPTEFALHQNYPNPFNPTTTIKFDLPKQSKVTIVIYNTLGQKVKTIFNSEIEAGFHEVTFDANGLSSNIYFYRIKTNDNVETRKMVVLK